jgi:hypothetical protein
VEKDRMRRKRRKKNKRQENKKHGKEEKHSRVKHLRRLILPSDVQFSYFKLINLIIEHLLAMIVRSNW